MGWRYLAQRLPSGEFIDYDIPLGDVAVTRTLSGPGRLTATVPVEVGHLVGADGRPVLTEWGTAIWAEADGVIRGGGILAEVDVDGPKLTVDCVGVSGYPQGMPWLGPDYAGVQVDPLDVVRMVWAHVQSYPDGNLGVVVDATRSPVRVGTEEEDVEFATGDGRDVAFTAGPFTLNWWSTDDLGKVLDELARDTPFDYLEHTTWDGDALAHRLQLGYPRIGGRREDLRLVIGENVTVVPPVAWGEYASEVLVLGAGEGAGMVRAHLPGRPAGRLRRVARVADKAADTAAKATARARAELAARVGAEEVTDLVLADHPHAPLGSIQPGDVVLIEGDAGWVDLTTWGRVVQVVIRPAAGQMTLSVTTEGGG